MRVWSLDLVWHVKEVEPLAEQPFPELPPYEIPEQDRDLWGVGCVLSPPREGSAPGCGEQTGR